MISEEIKKKAITAIISIFAVQRNQLNEFITAQNVQVIKLLQLLRQRKARNRKKSQKVWTKMMTQNKKFRTWCEADEDFLVELWAYKLEDLRGPRKDFYTYQEMSESLAAVDAFYSPIEIKLKLHSLYKRYRKEKRIVGLSGESTSEWRLYQRINSILGKTKPDAIDALMVEDTPLIKEENILPSTPPPLSWASLSESSTLSDDMPSAKRRKRSLNTELNAADDMIRLQLQAMNETDNKLLKLEEERNSILREFVNSCDKFHTDLLNLLKK